MGEAIGSERGQTVVAAGQRPADPPVHVLRVQAARVGMVVEFLGIQGGAGLG